MGYFSYGVHSSFIQILKACLNYIGKNYSASFMPINLVFGIYAGKRSMGIHLF
jgi:hypothetical protein